MRVLFILLALFLFPYNGSSTCAEQATGNEPECKKPEREVQLPIKMEDGTLVTVFGNNGRVLKQIIVDGEKSNLNLCLQDMDSGTYFISVKSEKEYLHSTRVTLK